MKLVFTSLLIASLFSISPLVADPQTDTPKRVLVVSTTTGYRHASIAALNKVIGQLAAMSKAFTVDYLEQPPGEPVALKPPHAPKSDATEAEKGAFDEAQKQYEAALPAYQDAHAKWMEVLRVALLKLSPESLKGYDGVIFASTTGDLPIPDKAGFLNWIKSGKAFIGIHAASDTFHGWPEYLDMLGGEFKQHGPQVGVECLNQDPQNPATASLPKVWTITQEEIYQFKNYDPTKVHELLIMDKHPNDKTPGHFPVSWCKNYGAGRVFYTSLGHRDDIIDTDPNIKDRKNAVEISKAYQAHLLGGIEWALGLK